MKFIILTAVLCFNSPLLFAQVYGCTDSLATNYNASATINDGSCSYNAVSITPLTSQNLDPILVETSGLINWNSNLWTHNDNTDLNLYTLDTLTGTIIATHPLNGVTNIDWEEISQDSNYVYIGDFGNNANGNRTNLKILRIEKTSLLNNSPVIDTIFFSYADQVNFNPTGGNNTDFDCEAFIVTTDSIFLFTKQWISNGTAVYAMPKIPGTHIASQKIFHNTSGLITGATMVPGKQLVVLSGYSNLIQPFIYCLYDFENCDFFSGNKRKMNLSLPFHQVEGISTTNGLKYYITNEFFTQPPIITIQQKLHVIDLSSYLSDYLNSLTSIHSITDYSKTTVYPNPADGSILVNTTPSSVGANFVLTDLSGRIIISGKLITDQQIIPTDNISPGIYNLRIENNNYQVVVLH